MALTNENKHVRLVPQIKQRIYEIRLPFVGALIQVHDGGITLGGVHPPRPGDKFVEAKKWISIVFEGTEIQVYPFIQACVNGTREIINQLRST
jgi:hypothetical protein